MSDGHSGGGYPHNVAIVSMSCRFPGASSPSSFWDALISGRELIRTSARSGEGAGDINRGVWLDGIEDFDAHLFGLSPQEARLLDPQHRLFLECSLEAMEQAGVLPYRNEAVGVFGGCGPSTYLTNNVISGMAMTGRERTLLSNSDGVAMLSASAQDFLTSQVAYRLGLMGPTVTVQAACATSLFAVHGACVSLLAGECDFALAGGAYVPIPQFTGYRHETGMVFSRDGHCRPFDADASGTLFGSGAGVVGLKRLEDAVRDGNRIHAVILGSALSNDGSRKVGFTAPNSDGQAQCLADALSQSGVKPEDLGFIEAHGTATPIGDPIEFEAICRAFGRQTAGRCAIGSVKSNLGHLGWASGIAGLIKAALATEHRWIPPTLNFRSPNPELGIERTRYFINDGAIEWDDRLAGPFSGVSAFGLGGVNAHVVLGPAPVSPPNPPPSGRPRLLPLSANSPGSLQSALQIYASRYEKAADEAVLDRDAHALGLHRHKYPLRACMVVENAEDAAAALKAKSTRAPAPPPATPGAVAFLFTGFSGSSFSGMGKELFSVFPRFRQSIESLHTLVDPALGLDLGGVVTGMAASPDTLAARFTVHVACQLALADLLGSFGVAPNVLAGHSLGEYSAAAVAGVLSPAAALALVGERGRLIDSLPRDGAMMAVNASEETLRAASIDDFPALGVAAINAPDSLVLAGPRHDLSLFAAKLASQGVKVTDLGVDRAGHSAFLGPILDDFESFCGGLAFDDPRVPLVSNLTGEVVQPGDVTPRYWRRHLRETVQFDRAMNSLRMFDPAMLVEVGPQPSLLAALARSDRFGAARLISTMRPNRPEEKHFLEAIAEFFEAGFEIDFSQPFAGERIPLPSLPAYPFDRQRHWIDPPAADPPRRGGEFYGVALSAVDLSAAHSLEGQVIVFVTSEPAPEVFAWGAVFTKAGARCAWLRQGNDAPVIADGRDFVWTSSCDLADPRAVAAALRTLREFAGQVDAIVSLAGANAEPSAASVPDPDCERASLALYGGALALVLASGDLPDPPRLIFISAFLGDDEGISTACTPDLSLILPSMFSGLIRTAAIERSAQSIGHLQVRNPDVATLASLIAGGWPARELVCIGDRILARRLERRAGPVAAAERASSPESFIITGGCRGLGLTAAERLVATGVGRLVLVSRNPPSAREAERIDSLSANGVDVRIVPGDVGDADFVRTLFEELERAGVAITGVVHAAGVLDDGFLEAQTVDRFRTTFAPKGVGAWNLHRFAPRSVRRFVCFSSASGLVGNLGQANYAAANAFLAGLHALRRARGLPSCVIHWGPWLDDGFLKDRPELAGALDESGMTGLPNADALPALDAVLAAGTDEVAFMANDWERFVEASGLGGDALYEGVLRTARSAPGAPQRPAPSTAQEELTPERITDAAEQALRACLPEADLAGNPAASFQSMGLDSLRALQIRNWLQAELRVTLPANLCFRYNTIDALQAYLLETVRRDAEAPAAGSGPQADSAPSRATDQTLKPSEQQRRWLRLGKLDYGRLVIPIVFGASYDGRAFETALKTVVGRHDVLRWYYPNDRTVGLWPLEDFGEGRSYATVDLRPLAEPERVAEIGRLIEILRGDMPDPTVALPWRIQPIVYDDASFYVLLAAQHLEFDGVSVSLFVDGMREAYLAALRDVPPAAPPVPGYEDYIREQARYLSNGADGDVQYLCGVYDVFSTPTLLDDAVHLEQTTAFPSRCHSIVLPPDCEVLLAEVSSEGFCTRFDLFSAAYAQLVADITGERDVLIGTIFSGRADPRFSETLGSFVVPYPLPFIGASTPDRRSLVRCNRIVAELNARSKIPVSTLLRTVNGFSHLPEDTYFTDAYIMLNNYQQPDAHPDMAVEVIECLAPTYDEDLSDYNAETLMEIAGLFLIIDETPTGHRLNFWYHEHRFQKERVQAWAAQCVDNFRKLSSGLTRSTTPCPESPSG